MKRYQYTVCLALIISQGLLGGEHYVSPTGDDANPGTREKPFKSITRARDAVRKINAKMDSDVVVHLGAGVYRLSETTTFGPEDSGMNGHKVIYSAEKRHKVILTGGVKVADWEIHDKEKNIFRAQVGKAPFRQFYVDGWPEIRARTPNLISAKDRSPYWPCVVPKIPKMKIKKEHWAAVAGVPEKKRGEIELVMVCHWYHQRVRIGAVDTSGEMVEITPLNPKGKFNKTPRFYQNSRGMKNPFYFENALAFVDAENEWYHDPDDGILYWALPRGATPDGIELEIPAVETLVSIKGTPEKPVRDLEFRGIAFQCTNWVAPSANGVNMTQGAQVIGGAPPPGAITAVHTMRLALRNCIVRNAGGNGVVLGDADETDLEGNQFYQIAANGISLDQGSGRNPAADAQSVNVSVWNNHARTCGNHYSNGDFLFAGNVKGLVVEHNLIHDMPYSGMQIGQQPGKMQDVGCGENLIRFNHIHHCNLIHGDGGGIYTLGGIQKGTVIEGNYLHDIRQSTWDHYKVSQIYLDNFSSQITVRDNVVNGGSADQRNKADKNHFIHNVQSNPTVEKAAGIKPGHNPRSR